MEPKDPGAVGDAAQLSVIGANLIINGSIEAASGTGAIDLQIEGQVNGDITCATLIVAEKSSINGNIVAERVHVSGTVDGDVRTNELGVDGSGRLTGDVVYQHIRVAEGGVVQGKMTWKSPEPGKLKLVETGPKSKRKGDPWVE